MNNTLNKIIETFASGNSRIKKAQVLTWMQDSNLEIMAVIWHHISKQEVSDRITPKLKRSEVFPFVLNYFSRALIEDCEGEWVDSRYSAARDLVGLIKSLWENDEMSMKNLSDFKKWLADLFIAGNHELKECIVNAILEHLFEDISLRSQFEDWKEDAVLSVAYRDALLWVQGSD